MEMARFDIQVLELIAQYEGELTPKGELWKKLLNRLPKKYWDRIYDFDSSSDLVDDCKYLIQFQEPYTWADGYDSLPVRSITEAVNFLKETHK